MSALRLPRLVLLFLMAALLWWQPATADWHRRDVDMMGTRISAELWHPDPAAGDAALDAVIDEFHRIDELMSTYIPTTQMSRINQFAAERAVVVDEELFRLIDRALELSVLTGGAFDITYDSVGYLYDYRRRQRPSEQQIASRLGSIDYRHVKLDQSRSSVRFAAPGVRINLGGIAKGYAVERGVAILRARGVNHAVVAAGGDSRVLGDRRGAPWIVGIRDPRADNRVVTRLPLVDEAVSTSGDYERFFDEKGIRYHHILDPDSGESAASVASVTILGPDATTTDGLSTSLFVLGVERGLTLITELEGYEAVVIDAYGRLFYSQGLAALGE